MFLVDTDGNSLVIFWVEKQGVQLVAVYSACRCRRQWQQHMASYCWYVLQPWVCWNNVRLQAPKHSGWWPIAVVHVQVYTTAEEIDAVLEIIDQPSYSSCALARAACTMPTSAPLAADGYQYCARTCALNCNTSSELT
jgi:hypothetical protein